MPQLNCTASFQQGSETVHFPVYFYKPTIGARLFRD
jgi:hypothetical protein